VVDDLVAHFFEVSHLMARCLKLKHEMKAALASYKGMYKGVKESEKLKITSFLTEASLPFCNALCSSVTLMTFSQEH
jgi:hypothetical protein